MVHALYPGSFDAVTYGHLDVVRRAARMFERITIAIADNPTKREPLFPTAERVAMLRECAREWPNVYVEAFPGLTVDFARKIGATVILRGLRAVSDFEFEFQMAMANDNLAPEITTMFMVPSPQFSFLSSSLVKEIANFGGDISHFVPPHVETAVREKFASQK
ncbi:MAG: pantetheine-phosphate adenylyltransferase [Candidatus Sumerlaeaceae bacterium]